MAENRAYEGAQQWAAHLDATYEAWQFCNDDGAEGRWLSKEAKAILREHEYDGDNKHQVLERIEEEARESVLAVDMRSGWVSLASEMEAEEFQILLSTGGPALRIMGELGAFSEPRRAWIQFQDWFKPWTDFTRVDHDALLWFCSLFYFGE